MKQRTRPVPLAGKGRVEGKFIAALCTLAIAGLSVLASSAVAQAWPTKPIRTIITVGGGMELTARLVSQGLTPVLGQPVLLEAQTGAGGSIGHDTVMRAAPDGHTLMVSVASTHITNGFLSKQSRFDPIKSYTPIGKFAESILLVTADASMPFDNVAQMVEYAKNNPGKLSYATTGIGSVHHFSAAAITALTGIDWVHVPYKAGPAALTAVVSGQTQIGWAILSTLKPFEKTGKLKVIGINMEKRFAGMPDVPTIGEQLKGYEAPPTWAAYFGPAGVPRDIVTRLNTEIVKIVNQPEVRAKVEASGSVVAPTSPEALADIVKRDFEKVARAVKLVGIKPE
jgi:tripartite-type tricarboxylate transporter receptor subunit TctC